MCAGQRGEGRLRWGDRCDQVTKVHLEPSKAISANFLEGETQRAGVSLCSPGRGYLPEVPGTCRQGAAHPRHSCKWCLRAGTPPEVTNQLGWALRTGRRLGKGKGLPLRPF